MKCEDCGVTKPSWLGGSHSCLKVGEPTIAYCGDFAPALYYAVTKDNIDWLTK